MVYAIIDDSTNNKSLAERFMLEPRQYEGMKIENIGFSNRLTNCLLRNGYLFLCDVVEEPYCRIALLSGYGKLCKSELFGFLKNLKDAENFAAYLKDNEEEGIKTVISAPVIMLIPIAIYIWYQ